MMGTIWNTVGGEFVMAEKPEDLSLPASVVARIIKDALPEGVNVSKEARTAVGKAASVFILYATACANNFALKGKRKTLSATDVLSALEDMEFEHFVPELKECLEAFKQEQKEKKETQAVRKRKKGSTTNTTQPLTTSPQQSQPLMHSEASPGTASSTKQSASAESASSSQGEDEGSMEVDPIICIQQTDHSATQLSVNSSV